MERLRPIMREMRRTLWQFCKIYAVVLPLYISYVMYSSPKPIFSCSTPTCIQEATIIKHQVDFNANPCNDFYGYACGNFKQYHHRITELVYAVQNQFANLYDEPIEKDDHVMIKSMKRLYNACISEIDFRESAANVEKIKSALNLVGGWPVLEGSKWDDSKFNWLEATYKFREVGYKFSIFLDLTVTRDPTNNSRHVFKVSLPKQSVVESKVMVEVAVILGAERSKAEEELNDVYILMEYLYENGESNFIFDTIEHYQKTQLFKLEWLHFINRIVSPTTMATKNENMIFPHSEAMKKRLDLLSKIKKRVLANYMVWRALEEIAPYLISDIQRQQTLISHKTIIADKKISCAHEIQQKFRSAPNPIDVMYLKRYVSYEKLLAVEEMVINIKKEFSELLRNNKWMDPKDSQEVFKMLKNIPLIIGAPSNYFNGTILDELNIDMKDPAREDFFSLMLRMNRNYQSYLFKKINMTVADARYFHWNLYYQTEILYKIDYSDTIEIPATILQGVMYNDKRPNYLNYGSLGSFIGNQFINQLTNLLHGCSCRGKVVMWSSKSRKGFLKLEKCIQKRSNLLRIEDGIILNLDMLTLRYELGPNISYSAYKKWEKVHGVEAELPEVAATNEQLFWISAAAPSCQPSSTNKISLLHNFSSYIVNLLGGNHGNFTQDFNCPIGSNMNPVDKCDIF